MSKQRSAQSSPAIARRGIVQPQKSVAAAVFSSSINAGIPTGQTSNPPPSLPRLNVEKFIPLLGLEAEGQALTAHSPPKNPSRENIGDDFFDRFCGLQTRIQDNKPSEDKKAAKTDVLPGTTIRTGKPSTTTRRQSRTLETGSDEQEELYVEVLYTIKHKIGQHGEHHYSSHDEDLLKYVQEAFGIDSSRHHRLLSKADKEKAPRVLLNITVCEARDLEAKDANGFSDPFCMLGLIGHKAKRHIDLTSTPSQEMYPDEKEAFKGRSRSSLYKHGGRSKSKRDCNADILEQLPAKLIRTTSVKKEQLNPVWNETFQLVVDNVNEDVLHLDIFDHDEEYQILDAVKNVKNVQGIKGLNRYFKQIAQSARKSADENVDDFLGCVDIRITDIPSIGIDKVFNLCSRSNGKAQGTIRLRLGFATREEKDHRTESNLQDFLQHRDLLTLFIKHEMKNLKSSLDWTGELSNEAESILHQHAMQGDLSDLQQAACLWTSMVDYHVSVARLNRLLLFQTLKHLDSIWVANGLSHDAEEVTAEAVGMFKDFEFSCLANQTYFLPMTVPPGPKQLESLLKSLRILYELKLFKRFFPLEDSFHNVVCEMIKTAAIEHYHRIRSEFLSESELAQETPGMEIYSKMLVALNNDIRQQFLPADKIYNAFSLDYFPLTMRELDRLITEDLELYPVLKPSSEMAKILDDLDPYAILKDDFFTAPGREEPRVEVFVLYYSLNDFRHLSRHLSESEQKNLAIFCVHERFIPFVLQWFSYAKVAAKRKIKGWVEKDKKISRGESKFRYSTSVMEANACLDSFIRFVVELKWPSDTQRCMLKCKLINDIAEIAAYFSEVTYRALKDCGWAEHEILEINDDLCVCVNNLETMRTHIRSLPTTLRYFERTQSFIESGDPVLIKFGGDCEAIFVQSLANGEKMLNDRIVESLDKLIKKMDSGTAGYVAKLVNDPSAEAEVYTGPLLELMDVPINSLYGPLLKANFLRFLELLWLHVLDQIMAATVNSKSKEAMNFLNIYQSFGTFIEYFKAGDRGLPREVIEGERYQSVKRKMFCYQLSTQELIDTFLVEATNMHSTMTTTPYGTLTIRSHYDRKTGTIVLEVLHARDVIPMDTNGFSDPFVVIRFLPARTFPNTPTGKTAVVKKTLDPQFEERFEFELPVEKCTKESSVIYFALMDHDVMFQNEVAGEAFVPLNKLPGLRGEQTKNFAGLKEVTLPMLHPKLMDKGILADIIEILKSRDHQKEGLEFLSTLFIA